MDVMDLRRRLMMGVARGISSNSMQIISCTILNEDHVDSSIANQKYWKDYLGIDDQTDNYMYFCLFYNPNYANAYKVNAIFYMGNSLCTMYRNGWSIITNINSNQTQYYLYATQGTEISVCKMKKN